MGKIIGGSVLEPGHKKYLGSFQHNNQHRCTICLISNKHCLTAASCLRDFFISKEIPNFDDYKIVLGTFQSTQWNIKYDIDTVSGHKKFEPFANNSDYDIGLITVYHYYYTFLENYIYWNTLFEVAYPNSFSTQKNTLVDYPA